MEFFYAKEKHNCVSLAGCQFLSVQDGLRISGISRFGDRFQTNSCARRQTEQSEWPQIREQQSRKIATYHRDFQ